MKSEYGVENGWKEVQKIKHEYTLINKKSHVCL